MNNTATNQPAPLAMTEIGPQRMCRKCGDWWPDDAEFFFLSKGKPRQPCKACYAELPSVIAKAERAKCAAKKAQQVAPGGAQ